MRFSVKTLLVLTAMVAVTLVCMMYPANLLGSAYYFAALATVFIMIVAAIQLRGSRRAFAVSFAVVAGGYLWVSTPSGPSSAALAQLGVPVTQLNNSQLLTTMLMYCCYEAYVDDPSVVVAGVWQSYPPRRVRAESTPVEYVLAPSLTSFLTIGHSVFAVWFGWLAGILGRRLHTKGNDLFQTP